MNRKNKLLVKKCISLFSVVRGYNIPILALAQYLSAIFILAPEKRALHILLDFNLFVLVLASSFSIASGYIINSFYDSKKDLINRPNKTQLDRLVSQNTKLRVYFGMNFFVALIAVFVSFRAFLFFSVYIFSIWFYSHKLKKLPFIGNISASILAVLPFFGILLYYKNFYEVILFHGSFLFVMLLIREMIKDLENIKGDLANDYQTIPIVYSEIFSKRIILCLLVLSVLPVYFLVNVFDVGYMDLYFYSSYIILIFFGLRLMKATEKKDYLMLHNLLKFLIVAGVFCILLIDPAVLWNSKKVLLSVP